MSPDVTAGRDDAYAPSSLTISTGLTMLRAGSKSAAITATAATALSLLLLATAPCFAAGNSSHAQTVRSAAPTAPKRTLGFRASTLQRHPVLAGRSRWVGGRYYGAAYYGSNAVYAEYPPADPGAVLGAWPVPPPAPVADPPPHRVVMFPVTIFYEYHPHWTINTW